MSPSRRIALAFGTALLASACTPRLTIKQEFWQDHQAKIGVALAPRPEAGAHKVGAQGLLDMAINAGMAAELKAHLQTVDVSEFDKVRERFVEELVRRGMNAVALPATLDPAAYPERPADAPSLENAYGRNLGALRTEQGLDAVVLLTIRRYGTIRSYFGFIPTGAPQGFFEVMGQMVDLKTGALLWQTVAPEKEAMVPASGDWDQPPGYPNLTAALRAAMGKGSDFLFREFFDAAPAAAPPPAADKRAAR